MFFKIIDDGVWYASEANIQISLAQVLQTTYHVVSSSGIYTYACKDWSRKPSAKKKWANSKIFIVLEYNKLREEPHLNDTKSGFQYANHAVYQKYILF